MSSATNPVSCPVSRKKMRIRPKFLQVLESTMKACGVSFNECVLIVGGSADDERLLKQAGFRHFVNSNLPTDMERMNGAESIPGEHLALDVENLAVPADSYDIVFASEVLHHCVSPHHALCEMLRVSRKYVIFLEPNDSWTMHALVKMKLSFPYELPAVIDHDYKSGGLRDSNIPNFIYRWTEHEVVKTVSSCIAERVFSVRAHPYWDLNTDKEELSLRKETRIGSITSVLGADNFLSWLRGAQWLLNSIPVLRSQGNKFFCCIEKSANLKPWMSREGDHVVFNRQFGHGR